MEEVADVEMEHNSSAASFTWVSVEATRASVHVVGCAATTNIHLYSFFCAASIHLSVSLSPLHPCSVPWSNLWLYVEGCFCQNSPLFLGCSRLPNVSEACIMLSSIL